MKTKTLASVSFLTILSACATSGTNIAADVNRIDFPAVGTTSTVRLGESMLKKSKIYKYEALSLDNEFTAGDGILTAKIRIPAQKLKAKSILKNNTLYMADEAYMSSIVGERPVLAGICIPTDPKKKGWRVYMNGTCTAIGTKNLPSHSMTDVYDSKKPSLTRELVYNGRVNNNVKIIYRELSNDVMRPAFQQDLQYDMSKSKEIAFKEVTLNVANADNKEITFVVKNHFDDLE